MSTRLDGKISIITGAGSGIGRATALRFAAEGATVVVNDLNAPGAEETASFIRDAGGSARVVVADVTSSEEVQGLIDSTVNEFGRLDVLYNNAGGSIPEPTHEMTIERYHHVIALNINSAFYGIHSALPVMMEQRSGVLLFTSSGAGLNGVLGLTAYGAAKAAVQMLVRNVAIEYGQYGIRANAISPGLMDTPAMRGYFDTLPEGPEAVTSGIPAQRLGQGADIASTAVFLASDESEYVTGVVVPVDGGVQAKMFSPIPQQQ